MSDRKITVYIADLDISQRSMNALIRNGITTLNQLEKYDFNKIISIKGLGENSLSEIHNILIKKEDIFKDFEKREEVINQVPADICEIDIAELNLSVRAQNALTKAKINTVGDLIHISKQNLSSMINIGAMTRNEIYNMVEKIISSNEDYRQIIKASDNDIDNSGYEEQTEGKGFDFNTIDILTNEFFVTTAIIADWFNLSRQAIYNALEKKSPKRRQKWTGKVLSESEYNILLNLIHNKSFEFSNDEVQCCCFNNKKDDFATVFVYKDEIKCFFLRSLPETLQESILKLNMQKYTERELAGESDGSVIWVLKKPYFVPNDIKRFYANATLRNMTADEYSKFLTGYPYSTQRTHTDNEIVEFFENSLINGKVYISSDPQNQWIRTIASKNGYGIKEFVELYGYEYSSEKGELTEEAARQRHIQELQKLVIDGNTVYFPSDSKIYSILNTYAYHKGISMDEYIQSLGFKRTMTPPEKQSYKLEEDMQIHEGKGTIENQVFAEYPLLGSKIFSNEILDKLDEYTKKYIDVVLREPETKLPMKAEMQITLSVINHAKNWDNEENNKFWEYIVLQYGYRNSSGIVERVIKDSIEDALKRNKRLFVETRTGREFKSTIVIHAMATKKSWMALFDFLFDFYKNNLNWKIFPQDPLIEIMIRALQGKLSGIESEDTETITIGSQLYRFQEGIRKLILLRPGYTRDLFEKLLIKIDGFINSTEESINTYEDQLCEEWFKRKLISIANSRKLTQGEETEGQEEQEVAVDYSRIKAKLILYKENQVRVVLPDIRLKNEKFTRVVLTILYNEEIVYQQPLSWYGNELGKTLNNVSIPLPDFIDTKNFFNIRVVIKCDDEEIYNSEADLYFKMIVFSGEREINPSRIERENYTLILPEDSMLECENIILTEIESFMTGGVKAYFAELKDGYLLAVNGVPIAFDHEIGLDIRVIAPAERSGAPTFWVDDKEYHFVKKDSYCSVIIDNPEVLNRYAILVNDLQVPVERLREIDTDQGEAYAVQIAGDNDLCKIQVLDLENEKLLYERNFYVISTISSEFNREFYYSDKDYLNAEYLLQINGIREIVYFASEDDEIRIPYKNGSIHTIIPKIKIEETTGKWFNENTQAWYIDDIPQNSLFKVMSSVDVSIKFLIGGEDILYDNNGVVSIGNVLQSMRGSEEVANVELEAVITGGRDVQEYNLTRVFYQEGFMRPPRFWVEKNQLYWDRGGAFIGKPDRNFILQLKGEDEDIHTFELNDQITCIDLPKDIPIGEYQYEISIFSNGLFKKTKEILAVGNCIIGDKNVLRFRNRRIAIESITDEGKETEGHIEIKPCYIDQIKYLGEKDTSEGYCPVYSGLLYALGSRGERFEFSFSEHLTNRGKKKMPVNPVRIVYINDNTLCITDPDKDGLYYYYYYDKFLEQKVYAITDQEYTDTNKDKYSIADLYSYRTERG